MNVKSSDSVRRLGVLHRNGLHEYLQAHECLAAPMLGNLLAAGLWNDWRKLRCGGYTGVYREGKLTGVMAAFNDGNLMVHAEGTQTMDELARRLPAMPFHTLWGLDCGHEVACMVEDLPLEYEVVDHLMMVQPEPSERTVPDLNFIRADDHELEEDTLRFMECCLENCFGFSTARDVLIQRMNERMPEEAFWVASDMSGPVAQAHIQAWTPHFGYVGGVATLPAYQGQGYARAVMQQMCRYIRTLGRTPSLTVKTQNTAAIQLYRSMGFEECGQVTVLDCHWQAI